MAKKKYTIALTAQERSDLVKLTKTGRTAAYKINHARILLKADSNQDGGAWIDREISKALNISVATIERVRERCVLEGIEAALNRRSQSNRRTAIDYAHQPDGATGRLKPRWGNNYRQIAEKKIG